MGTALLLGVAAGLGLLALSDAEQTPPKPVRDDCSTPAETDEFEAWLLAATQHVLEAVEAEGTPNPGTPREQALGQLRGHMHAAWSDIPCDPAANVTTVEAWRMLGCSVVYQLSLIGVVDEEPGEVLRLCDEGDTFIPIVAVVDEEDDEDDDEADDEYEGYVWELWVQEDGSVVDEYGYEYGSITEGEVCPGDTLLLITPAKGTRFVSIAPSWLVEVETAEEGVYEWAIVEPEEGAGDEELDVEVGVEMYDEQSGQHVLFGYRVTLSDIEWACAA